MAEMCEPEPSSSSQTLIIENMMPNCVVLIIQPEPGNTSGTTSSSKPELTLECNTDEHKQTKNVQNDKLQHNYLTPWDVSVIVNDGTRYGIHKFLLNLASPLWEQQLKHCVPQNGKNIIKLDVSASTFEVIKHFLYTSFIPIGINMTKALQVLESSYAQSIGVIKEPITNWIEVNLRPGSVAIKVLQLARIHGIDKLTNAALAYISRHSRVVFNSKEFLSLDADSIRYILSSDNLACNELTVFNAMLKWATDKATRDAQISLKKSLASRLDDVINCVRFPLMTSHEISSVLSDLPEHTFLSKYNQEQIMTNLQDPASSCFNSSPRISNL